MRALIHEIIVADEGCSTGKTYDVPELDEELDRLDQSGLIFTVTGSAPDPEIDGIHVWITFFI